MNDWLTVIQGDAPLIVSMPHAGADIPADIEAHLVSPWLARKDADWRVDDLYAFAKDLGATIVRTAISRTVIDVNRDPSGISLYPGQATTTLCPEMTFDGEPLYISGAAPDGEEIARRRTQFFEPYHAALSSEIARLRERHATVVLYDAHSIRSRAPMLFDGLLPVFNIGSNSGASCAPALTDAVARRCSASGLPHVVNGRFKGGYITRFYGRPDQGVHAIQMELAIRGYMDEPDALTPDNWPALFEAARAAPIQTTLRSILNDCIALAEGRLP